MVVSLVAPPSGGDAHLSLNQRHLGDTIQGLIIENQPGRWGTAGGE